MDVRTLLRFPRYSDRAFPPYRFVPGRNPHPTADPRGHSYIPPGQSEPAVELVPPDRWQDSLEYRYGADLYNHGYWWEAHEAWEALWQLTDKKSPQGFFLQGLIQVAACHLKLFVGQTDGVRRLVKSSTGYLEGVRAAVSAERYMGLNLQAFIEQVRRYFDGPGGELAGRAEHDPAAYPYVVFEPQPTDDG